ncbi:transposase family protein [Frankia sp. CNm7]|uniref:Transposase family protein n=1 Tax=Frankia nepalensis TaxID=1836974 RepID=A0A937RFF2_9ACTN|nr:DDE-type integrase/transposase/recombinase [Frankia nepalensis]MBL7499868.1 transposase family protein [Frankia nepalensis]MBL7512314.1 transposase family protein [Frankia nepalensis]MBL7516962.1 transposase family protein [Frankia nepalensis]MBL7629022.1 transposase family protein [Frankia nepalensis]
MGGAFDGLRAAGVPVSRACFFTGRARATHYRHAAPGGRRHGPWPARKPPPAALTEPERAQVLAVLNSPGYQDLAIPQVWARELDAGRYWCSLSTMYRIARAAGQTAERRALASHPPRVRPELSATGPGEVWTWDITALKGPAKGIWYKLYVILDIYSRYVTGWLVAAAEDAVVAKDFLADAIRRNGTPPVAIHADRGGAMISKPVSELLVDLGVTRSHSRPRTSNDNPYSEAQFKTLKYSFDFPDRFGCLGPTPGLSARGSSPPTTTTTDTPGSGSTPRPRSTSAPPTRSRPTARPPSTAPRQRTPNGSAAVHGHLGYPRPCGSTSQSQANQAKTNCLI